VKSTKIFETGEFYRLLVLLCLATFLGFGFVKWFKSFLKNFSEYVDRLLAAGLPVLWGIALIVERPICRVTSDTTHLRSRADRALRWFVPPDGVVTSVEVDH
jgi:hypothetical protein